MSGFYEPNIAGFEATLTLDSGVFSDGGQKIAMCLGTIGMVQ
jgi:hypothetical protein